MATNKVRKKIKKRTKVDEDIYDDDTNHWRFTLTAEKYFERTHVMIYLEDAIAQLLVHKEDNPKVNTNKFFSSYFASVKCGSHILFRDFNFVKATRHNRLSFVKAFWKCFCNIGRKGDLLSTREYHSLACLLCPDFPWTVVQKSARIILMDDAVDCLISFTDFIYAFQLQLCYDEFLSKGLDVFRSMVQTVQGLKNLETVVVPTSEETSSSQSPTGDTPTSVSLEKFSTTAAASAPQDVDATQFYSGLLTICNRFDICFPPTDLLNELLSTTDRVTFYGFLLTMTKNSRLIEHLGALPQKSELFVMTEKEMNLESQAIEAILAESQQTLLGSPTNNSTVPPSRPRSASYTTPHTVRSTPPSPATILPSPTAGNYSSPSRVSSLSSSNLESRSNLTTAKYVSSVKAFRPSSAKEKQAPSKNSSRSTRRYDTDDDDDDPTDDDTDDSDDTLSLKS